MDTPLDSLGPRAALLAVEDTRRDQLSADARMLALAAHWCDLHGEVTYDPVRRAVVDGSQELVRLGGRGTPEVEEFAAAEFAAMAHQHPMGARSLMADALDLRHRLPKTWHAVAELRVPVWVARKIAARTRDLSVTAAGRVDAVVNPYLESLTPGRLLRLVEARTLEADPDAAEAKRRAAEAARYVQSRADSEGLRVLIARASAGDVIVFEAMVQRIASILADQGDEDLLEVRRSKALGILAHPATALKLLLDAGLSDEEITSRGPLSQSWWPAAGAA